MSWKLIDGPKSLKVTRSFAKSFTEMPSIKRDRGLSPARLAHHRQMLEMRKLRSPEWATAYCSEDGVEYRVNGNHTSTVFSEAAPELTKDVKVILSKYQCDTLEDVADLWATFDSKSTTRTAADIYAAFAGSCPQLDGIGRKELIIVSSGLGVAMNPERHCTAGGPEVRAAKLIEELDFTVWAAKLIEGNSNRLLRRAAVVAAMYDTWKKARGAAEEFWGLVKTGEGSSPSTPDRKLQKFLLETNVAFGGGAKAQRVSSNREVYVRCIHAWNAWRRGESTEMKYHSGAKIPRPV